MGYEACLTPMGWYCYNLIKSGLLNAGSRKLLRPEYKSFKDLTQQGFLASMNMATVAIGIFVITYFISRFGKEAVAAYGIATRIEQIALLPTIGLNIATLSLVGQNMGANKCHRVRETLNTTLKYGAFISLFGLLFLFIFSKQLMGIFTGDEAVITIGSGYLKIAAFLLWSYVIMFINVSALQGMKRPMFALWIGLGRQIVAPIVVFYFFIYVIETGLLCDRNRFAWNMVGNIWNQLDRGHYIFGLRQKDNQDGRRSGWLIPECCWRAVLTGVAGVSLFVGCDPFKMPGVVISFLQVVAGLVH